MVVIELIVCTYSAKIHASTIEYIDVNSDLNILRRILIHLTLKMGNRVLGVPEQVKNLYESFE